jgi:hypothetical protein
MTAKTTEKTETSTEMTQPVIIDLGRQKAAAVKALKEGEGELWDEVDEVKDMLGKDADGKVLVPVVLIYEKKQSQSQAIEKVLFPLLNRDEDDESDDEEE